MLQFGGHHYALNIAYRNGAVIGATPAFRGIEPTAFMPAGGAAVSLLKRDKDAFAVSGDPDSADFYGDPGCGTGGFNNYLCA